MVTGVLELDMRVVRRLGEADTCRELTRLEARASSAEDVVVVHYRRGYYCVLRCCGAVRNDGEISLMPAAAYRRYIGACYTDLHNMICSEMYYAYYSPI